MRAAGNSHLTDADAHSSAVSFAPSTYTSRRSTDVNSLNALGSESFGRAGTYAVNFAIVANQVGTVAAYQQFIGTNLLNLFPTSVGLPLSFWVMVWCVVLIPLCCIREMKVSFRV